MQIQDLILPAEFDFCNSLNQYSRFKTREVRIGSLPMGAHHPIRVQSMTTTDTMDTKGTVEQTIRMVDSGCEYVRITAPSMKEAQNLAEIKKELQRRGVHVPLIADIHFTPNAAELAARIVEKVRINPGNYADKKRFEQIEFSTGSYDAELDRIRKKFVPLVKICKEYGTAMRIGTNHGSLSDRIMSYYGDTPLGMVESAMEFIRICCEENYYELVISMKSSNPQVMVQAYRLLVHTMIKEGLNFPLHLGVTEAGDGEDGRIKSALGIGTLLEDGLGDTIRVSLTEEPEKEVPVAMDLVQRYAKRESLQNHPPEGYIYRSQLPDTLSLRKTYSCSPYSYEKRLSRENEIIGGTSVPRVFADLSTRNLRDPGTLAHIGYRYSAALDKFHIDDMAADFAYFGTQLPSFALPGGLRPVYDLKTWEALNNTSGEPDASDSAVDSVSYPLLDQTEYLQSDQWNSLHFINLFPGSFSPDLFEKLSQDEHAVIILESREEEVLYPFRQLYFELMHRGLKVPVIFRKNYPQLSKDQFLLYASADFGSLFLDGFGDGLWLQDIQAAFALLQATRTRISKTEYISCPSCGRTLFDLQEVTQLIRSRTSHLKGVKIAIMGCIVNGPGEMADADYGYVGAGPGKITLYRGKEVVRKNVESDKAVDELIDLIREDGSWVEIVG